MNFKGTFADTGSSRTQAGHVRHSGIIVGSLLLLFIGLALSAVEQKSPTLDESFHLLAGYSHLKWRDFRINPEHPPLAKLMAALPLLLLDTNDAPLSREERDEVETNVEHGWRLANRWLFSSNDAETIFRYARLPMLLVGALLGLLVFAWARELYGLTAAFAALTFYVFDPNMLAYAPLVHTDLTFTMTFFGGTFFFWRTLRELTWLNVLLTLAFFSAAAITKFSFVTVPLIWAILAMVRIVAAEPLHCRLTARTTVTVTGKWAKAGWLTALLLVALLCAYCIIWAAYGFRYEAASGEPIPLSITDAVTPSRWLIPLIQLNQSYHLLPEAWLSGLVYVLSASNRTAYLLGETSDGFWLFFPIAIAVKTPLPTLLLLLGSLVVTPDQQKIATGNQFLWMPVSVFLSLAIYSRTDIGLRHILPTYPFLFVWLGGVSAALLRSPSIAKRCAVCVLGLWLVGSCVANYPDYLAYFNETLGDRERHAILVDSNLDWGQDLKGLKRWMVDQKVERIELAYFGTADPAYYGIDAIYKPGTWSAVLSKPPDSTRLRTATYIAISATHLVGLYFAPQNPYASFLRKKPVAAIGHSIFIYRTDR